ncbi:MAG: XylR family transcriptional regulator [Akkermansiaceae bacterium]|jgi:LacI family transcriptional regulator|nr:XylR family transcriptional regulator [Akkermansiaceae bacterium]
MKKERSNDSHEPLRIAVLVDSSTMWGRNIIRGVHRFNIERGGWHLFVEPRGIEERQCLPRGWKGDGVIARVGFPELASRLKKLNTPVVNVSGISLPKVSFPRVASDQDAAAALAARHLLERGFRHFAYFSPLAISYVADHHAAFANTLAKAGFSCPVFEVPAQLGAVPDWNLDVRRVAKWLRSQPKPLAVFAWNANSARELLQACTHAGIAVPRDVAVLSGGDDDLFCEIAPVPISAVQLGTEAIGYHAAALLDSMIRQPNRIPTLETKIPPLGICERLSTDTMAAADESMAKALRFIRAAAGEVIQVDDVARHAGLCRRSLEQRFRALLGCSPATEIRRVRIARAVDLLRSTNLSVAAIAEKTGFSSSEYMSSVFRSRLGTTPTAIRSGGHQGGPVSWTPEIEKP